MMNDGLKQIFKQSFVYTALLIALIAFFVALFWPDASRTSALFGLFWGALIAITGFWMICSMVSNLSQSIKQEKKKGRSGYFLRYAFYAACLAFGAWLHFSVITMLLGILAQKASLVLYSLKNERTENE